MTLTTTDAKARRAELEARGRAAIAARTTHQLCDMYVLAIAQRNNTAGDELDAAHITLRWIADELQNRDSHAADVWNDAEEVIDMELIARDEWTPGASDLPPHPFFGIDTPSA
jgi:hypothetical protein